MKKVILTGIKPTGVPHLGNYFGAIKPSIELQNTRDADCYYFLANYHALTTVTSAKVLEENTFKLACTWLACGLDPKRSVFYKQSDIPEIFELVTILNNITPKGLLNRAHAYKSAVEENKKSGFDSDEQDKNINMGLYNYPVLMAGDIVTFNSTHVPVGKDQKQHIEIARDIVGYFNSRYGNILTQTNELINAEVEIIMGLDGRKMSKSYNNVIPLIISEKDLFKLVRKIKTDSTAMNEPKGKDNAVYELYKLFATPKQLVDFEELLSKGVSWGDAKNQLATLMNATLAPIREKYDYYFNRPALVNKILCSGAKRARKVAKTTLKKVKNAVGV